MPKIEGTLGDMLGLIGTDSVLTYNVIKALEGMAPRQLADIHAMSGLTLAGEIKANSKGAVNQPLAVANRIKELIIETFGDDKPSSPSGPLHVEVTQQKTLGQYSLRELLEALAANPQRHAEILPILQQNPQYAAAAQKSANLGIPADTGGLDAEATTAYIDILTRPFAKAQRMFSGQRPAAIEKLLGIEVRALIHPFTLEPIQGPDENGFDWGMLPDELHKALLWAHATKHSAWPTSIDVYQHGSELFSDVLPARWQRIVEDYRAACEQDESSIITSRYHTQESVKAYARLTGSRRHTATTGDVHTAQSGHDYQSQLENIAQRAGNLEASGNMTRLQGGVYSMVKINGNMCQVAPGTVIMHGGKITGNMCQGVIYAPLGVMIKITGNMCSVQIVHRPYEELARIAGLA